MPTASHTSDARPRLRVQRRITAAIAVLTIALALIIVLASGSHSTRTNSAAAHAITLPTSQASVVRNTGYGFVP